MKSRSVLIVLLITFILLAGCFYIERNLAKREMERQINRCAELQEQNKALTQSQKTWMIYGYITGYTNANGSKFGEEIPEFAQKIVSYSDEFGVNPDDIMIICQHESGFDLYARGGLDERGPGQVLPDTWIDYYQKLGYQLTDFFDWRCNLRVTVAYFADLVKDNKGDTGAAAGCYNGGPKWESKESARKYSDRFVRASRGGLKLEKKETK